MGRFRWPWQRGTSEPQTWQVRREGDRVHVIGGREPLEFGLRGARCIRVVPLGGGNMHARGASGWQVAVRRDDGDIPIGTPRSDWQAALALAHNLMDVTDLPLDELSRRLVGDGGSPKYDLDR